MAFDPAAATAAYINSLGAPALAKAAAYTTGNEWILLWNLVVIGVVTWIGVRLGVMRWLARRLERRGIFIRNWVMLAGWFLVSALLSLPWDIYAGWWRELSYGRTSQPFGDFLGQHLLSVAIFSVVVGLFFVGIYALIRRAGRRWWLAPSAEPSRQIGSRCVCASLARPRLPHRRKFLPRPRPRRLSGNRVD